MSLLPPILIAIVVAGISMLVALARRRWRECLIWLGALIAMSTVGVLLLQSWNRVMLKVDADYRARQADVATTSPASTAYTDGFEVVVFELRDGIPTNVRSLPLKDAEQAIASGSQSLIPGDPAAVQRQIPTGKGGDSKVLLSVQSLADTKQQVRVSFHESGRTFVYKYAVDGVHVRPVSSEHRDLAKSKVVRYAGE
jgi:hypothetical protein